MDAVLGYAMGRSSTTRFIDNSVAGIDAYYGSLVQGNKVYSNGTGIIGDNWRGAVSRVRSSTTSSTPTPTRASSSTTPTAPRSSTTPSSSRWATGCASIAGLSGILLRNNIIWIEAGYDIDIATDSLSNFDSNYNDLYHGSDPRAKTGLWGGQDANSLADWQTLSGSVGGDLHSIGDFPSFVNPAGTDNVLGYSTLGGGYNGGVDDNFGTGRPLAGHRPRGFVVRNHNLTPIFSTGTRSLHDVSGIPIDGDGDGVAGGNYVRTFMIDEIAPTSAVAPLPAMAADTTFTVRWSGSDDANGSGLLDYTVYVSDNGGAYAAWLTNTTLTEADYIGESGHSYAFYSVARDNAGNVEAAPAVPDAVTTAPDEIPPTVTRVLVASSAWSSDFLNSLGGVGYAIPDGFNQLCPLPGGNLNEVIIEFSEDVHVAEGDLVLTGVNVPSYGFSAFSYDAVTHRATWTISRNLPRDQLLVDLDGSTANAVVDLAGNRLDGDFQFRLNVLPGDVNQDGTVDAKDLEVLATNYRKSVLGWANGDFNCDGVVNVLDLAVLAANYRHTLGGLSLSGPALEMAAILGSATPTRRPTKQRKNLLSLRHLPLRMSPQCHPGTARPTP